VSLLDVAADTLGIAMKAEAAVGKLMSKGVMAGGSLETAQALGDEAIENLRESLAERHSGADNAGDWMVLEQGLTAKPFATSARDAQLVELRKQEAEEMARFTGVPRPLLMFDETSWGSGIEQLGLFFVTYCLLAWFVIWEEAIWRLLEPAEQEAVDGSMLYAKINERALLRGSMKEQAEFMAKALGSGGGEAWITQNEARDNFDLNPLDGGDDLPRRGTSAATILEEKQNG
jgi:HK97 family phage portal protein